LFSKIPILLHTLLGKPSGFVFDYLNNEEFKNIKIIDKRVLSEEQINILYRARCTYISRLKRIAEDIGIEKLPVMLADIRSPIIY
jgi:hypothetical protein